jgi:hypothetical protein
VRVHFRSLDVDDPSANTPPIDDESRASDNCQNPVVGPPHPNCVGGPNGVLFDPSVAGSILDGGTRIAASTTSDTAIARLLVSTAQVSVTVAVNVSDDTDPTPDVKLVSITCNDACKPAQDIAGATLGTDDRDLQLRAERMGGGSGRAYRVTYSATDASGNKTSATTAVVVPHDQGK